MHACEEGLIPLSNQYMFGRVMCREDICREFLERVLGMHIKSVSYVNREQVLEPVPDTRGVRLDVYAESDCGVFDIEMQAQPRSVLGRRLRYYQAAIDSRLMERGDDFDQLAESYIIFICAYDPFGCGLPAYTFERCCIEDTSAEAAWVVSRTLV